MKYRLTIIDFCSLLGRWVFLSSLCIAGIFSTSPARSQSASPPIVLRLPDGFCELGGSDKEVERREALKDALGVSVDVISFSAPCSELANFVSTASTSFQRWASLLRHRPTNKASQDATNDLYIQQIARQAAENPSDTLERLEKRLQRQVREQAAIWPIESGPLAWDIAAYYGGMESAVDSKDKQITVMSLTAVSVIKGIFVSSVLFEVATPASSYGKLLQQQRMNISQIVELNK